MAHLPTKKTSKKIINEGRGESDKNQIYTRAIGFQLRAKYCRPLSAKAWVTQEPNVSWNTRLWGIIYPHRFITDTAVQGAINAFSHTVFFYGVFASGVTQA